ncbi:YggS family pyridoxal phosphate-dependent enzyme [Novibacillus thermophilus]|uniref:Pyridoxal phosphate homeostasis protein n=1 Tax=Novibacillus thermophilus TaxID=1471761 RepID=A0A1U9K677_9BACL|nr:YggS family pyridoxal phosphate-dependent enzyme [Novibacillus thermophilus]AQS55528.1 YggS family pyridoxal phosphate enzyme [Novibacillus thermophilus]
MDSQTIARNIERVKATIADACRRSGRRPEDVRLIAVTKYVGIDTTRAVLDLGIEHIGENRVQEAVPKYDKLGSRGTWHFIGHLQSNKVKNVLGRFTYIHSLDRHSLAKEIQKRAAKRAMTVNCLLQVNVSGEKSKFGLAPSELVEFAKEVAEMSNIRIVGLMTMAPFVDNPEEVRPVFRELRSLRDQLYRLELPQVGKLELSMGMSNDYTVAIEEGATMVRLGSVLVGRES